MTNYYSLFNQVIKSSINLSPLFISNNKNYNIEVKELEKNTFLQEKINKIEVESKDNNDFVDFGETDNYFVLNFNDLSSFYISKDFKSVEFHNKENSDLNTLRHLIIDQVLPRIINKNNSFIIHSSSVKVNDQSILFIGNTGTGKSTLAAAFMNYGYKILSDDLVCIEKKKDNIFIIHSSYPALRMWPNTLNRLNISNLHKDRVSKINDKALLIDTNLEHFQIDPISIGSIYILNPTSESIETKIEEIKKIEAFKLITQSIFRLDMFKKDLANEFNLLNELLKKINIYSLNYTKNFNSLGNMIDLIVSNENKQ